MREKVWQATVYGKSHELIGTFHFLHLVDLERSVRETWLKEPDTIKELNMTDMSRVWVYSDNNGVAIEAILIEIDVLKTWTHF